MTITERTEHKFSAFQLLKVLSEQFKNHGVDESRTQLLLTHSIDATDPWYDGSGSLYDYDSREFTQAVGEFTHLNQAFVGTYVENVYDFVKTEAEKRGRKIGRVRRLSLLPKTCYSLHRDPLDEFRFHIPLVTDSNCFFVNDDVITRMPERGRLYVYDTTGLHTAVNASLSLRREHLVFDTFLD